MVSRLWLGAAPAPAPAPAPAASCASGHGESRVPTLRVVRIGTASRANGHGESADGTRRVPHPGTASPAAEHAAGHGVGRPVPPPVRDLATRQAELVAALVASGPAPEGFDPVRLDATRRALLRKRAGEAARAWPVLAASLGGDWQATFAAHHAGAEPVGALREGWDLARDLHRRGAMATGARAELAERDAAYRYDGRSAPRPSARARACRWVAALLRR